MPYNLDVGDTILSYNGVEFDSRTRTLGIDVRPHYDQSGRVVVYHEFTFVIHGYVLVADQPASGDANDQYAAIERALCQPAGEFRYESKGLGHNFRINRPGGGGRRDCVWGPKTRNLHVEPHGDIALEITWTVSMALASCPEVDPRFRIMEFCFRLHFEIDGSGYTRRVYSGYFRIPQTRRTVDDRRLSDTADKYRELIIAAVPPGFRPVSQSFPLSEDKCRMDFNLVAEQMPAVPPADVVHCSASHAVSTNRFLATTALWAGTIRGSYEVERGKQKTTGLDAFIRLANERKDLIEAWLPKKEGKPFKVLWSSLSMEEPELYGRLTCQAALTYQTVLDRKTLIFGSGLWRPVKGANDWVRWSQSLRESVFHARGHARLRHLPEDDILVDLCDDRKPKPPGLDVKKLVEEKITDGSQIFNEYPDASTSYIRYDSEIVVQVVDDVVELKALDQGALRSRNPTPPPEPDPFPQRVPGPLNLVGFNRKGAPPPGAFGPAVNPPTPPRAPSTDVPDDTPSIQTRCRPTIRVTLVGSAARAGYPVTPPTLVRIGKYRAVPANRPGNGFAQRVAANWMGVPIHVARWSFSWLLEGLDGDIPIPANLVNNPW